jgi:hypothetical protein
MHACRIAFIGYFGRVESHKTFQADILKLLSQLPFLSQKDLHNGIIVASN